MSMTEQRRQPVSYAELQETLRTGVFPSMGEPVKLGEKPFCSNCKHWTAGEPQGICSNLEARKHALFGDGRLGGIKALRTGENCHCPEHEFQ